MPIFLFLIFLPFANATETGLKEKDSYFEGQITRKVTIKGKVISIEYVNRKPNNKSEDRPNELAFFAMSQIYKYCEDKKARPEISKLLLTDTETLDLTFTCIDGLPNRDESELEGFKSYCKEYPTFPIVRIVCRDLNK